MPANGNGLQRFTGIMGAVGAGVTALIALGATYAGLSSSIAEANRAIRDMERVFDVYVKDQHNYEAESRKELEEFMREGYLARTKLEEFIKEERGLDEDIRRRLDASIAQIEEKLRSLQK